VWENLWEHVSRASHTDASGIWPEETAMTEYKIQLAVMTAGIAWEFNFHEPSDAMALAWAERTLAISDNVPGSASDAYLWRKEMDGVAEDWVHVARLMIRRVTVVTQAPVTRG